MICVISCYFVIVILLFCFDLKGKSGRGGGKKTHFLLVKATMYQYRLQRQGEGEGRGCFLNFKQLASEPAVSI